jgi:hypothetical protein
VKSELPAPGRAESSAAIQSVGGREIERSKSLIYLLVKMTNRSHVDVRNGHLNIHLITILVTNYNFSTSDSVAAVPSVSWMNLNVRRNEYFAAIVR